MLAPLDLCWALGADGGGRGLPQEDDSLVGEENQACMGGIPHSADRPWNYPCHFEDLRGRSEFAEAAWQKMATQLARQLLDGWGCSQRKLFFIQKPYFPPSLSSKPPSSHGGPHPSQPARLGSGA